MILPYVLPIYHYTIMHKTTTILGVNRTVFYSILAADLAFTIYLFLFEGPQVGLRSILLTGLFILALFARNTRADRRVNKELPSQTNDATEAHVTPQQPSLWMRIGVNALAIVITLMLVINLLGIFFPSLQIIRSWHWIFFPVIANAIHVFSIKQ